MQPDERYQPLALISVTLIALLGFAVFFLSFLVAPLAILIVFYVGFAASNRSKKDSGGPAPADADADADAKDGVLAVDDDRRIGYRSGGSSALLTRDARARQDTIDQADDDARAEAARTQPTGP